MTKNCLPLYVAYKNVFQNGREVSLVTITDDLEADVSVESKRVVVVLARIHPCDTASSFVIQGIVCYIVIITPKNLFVSITGMMEFLATSHGIARDLRRHVVFKFFPVMCPDGVFLGNSRSTLLGADLNRSWHKANQFHHPVLWKVKQYILQLSQVVHNCITFIALQQKINCNEYITMNTL